MSEIQKNYLDEGRFNYLPRADLALLVSETIAPISIVYSKISRKYAGPFVDENAIDPEEQKVVCPPTQNSDSRSPA
jgi:hypothetical protein